MIHIEKKNGSTKVKAVGSLPILFHELGHATGAILNHFLREDMTEEEMENFWAEWVKICRKELEGVREQQKNNDPNLRQKSYMRKPYPWEKVD